MKKIFVYLLVATYVLTCQAQLRIYSSGNVNIGDSLYYPTCHLTLADNNALRTPFGLFGISKAGMTSFVKPSESYNYGVLGGCLQSNSILANIKNYGVYGISGSSISSYNYGVYGCLLASGNGAAIWGSSTIANGIDTNGRYAGYFHGNTYTTGTATITNLVQPSDERLKMEHICI